MYERHSEGYNFFVRLVGDQNIGFEAVPGRAWIRLTAKATGGLYHPWMSLEVPIGLPELQEVGFCHLIEMDDPEDNFWTISPIQEVFKQGLSGFFRPMDAQP